jgi:hypothetical protein
VDALHQSVDDDQTILEGDTDPSSLIMLNEDDVESFKEFEEDSNWCDESAEEQPAGTYEALYSKEIEAETSTVFNESMWQDDDSFENDDYDESPHDSKANLNAISLTSNRNDFLHNSALVDRSYELEISFNANVGEILENEETQLMFDVVRDAVKLINKRYLPQLREYNEMLNGIQQLIKTKQQNRISQIISSSLNNFQNLKEFSKLKQEVLTHRHNLEMILITCNRLNISIDAAKSTLLSKSLGSSNQIDESKLLEDNSRSNVSIMGNSTSIRERRAKAEAAFNRLRLGIAKRKKATNQVANRKKQRRK